MVHFRNSLTIGVSYSPANTSKRLNRLEKWQYHWLECDAFENKVSSLLWKEIGQKIWCDHSSLNAIIMTFYESDAIAALLDLSYRLGSSGAEKSSSKCICNCVIIKSPQIKIPIEIATNVLYASIFLRLVNSDTTTILLLQLSRSWYSFILRYNASIYSSRYLLEENFCTP